MASAALALALPGVDRLARGEEAGGKAGDGKPTETDASSPSKDRSPKERALEYKKKATEALAAGRKAEAADLLAEAWALEKDPSFICNRGKYLAELARPRDAAEALSTCLRVLPPKEMATVGKTVERALTEARAHVATLTITTNVPEAEILIDQQVIGTTPLPGEVFVEPGRHGIVARARGLDEDARIFEMAAGSWFSVALTLKPKLNAPVAAAPTVVPPPTSASGPSPIQGIPNGEGGAASPDDSPRVGILVAAFGVAAFTASLSVSSFISMTMQRHEAVRLSDTLHQLEGNDPCTNPNNLTRCKEFRSADAFGDAFLGVGVATMVVAAASGAVGIWELARSRHAASISPVTASVTVVPGGGAFLVVGRF